MKILFLSRVNPYPPTDGGKAGIFYPTKFLREKGIDTLMVFPVSKEEEKNVELLKEKYRIKAFGYPFSAQNSIFGLFKNIFEVEPFTFQKYFNKSFYNFIKKIVINEKPNIVFSHHAHMGKYALLLKKEFGPPIILKEHNLEYEVIKQFSKITKNPIYKILALWQQKKTETCETKLWNEFDKIIFVSPVDYQEALKKNSKIKAIPIPDGVDLSVFRPKKNIKKEKNTIIFTGPLKTIPNFLSIKKFIKETLPLIKKRIPLIKFYITGEEKNKLYKILKNFKRENINHLGFIDNLNNLNQKILSKQVFISPTIMGRGLRIKVLNAMALGMPIVCTPIDAQSIEGGKENEHFMVGGNPEEFAQKTIFLIENRDIACKIGYNAHKLIEEKYNWNEITNKYLKVCQEFA